MSVRAQSRAGVAAEPRTPIPKMGRSSASALPPPVGPLSEFVITALRAPVGRVDQVPPIPAVDAVDDDLQLALYCCYELHYRGFAGVDDRWEWDPALLAFRAGLERAFSDALIEELAPLPRPAASDIGDELRRIINNFAGPSLSTYMLEQGTVEDMREFCIHRSAYQLKEADPHSWALPRLDGQAKAALVTIQFDEYGEGINGAMHAQLFADTMDELGLSAGYGQYLPLLAGTTLATCNLASMFGLHRRWRGALVGHLSAFEMTSVVPMKRYSSALGRFGYGPRARRFYDVHVAADEWHQVIAARDLAGGLASAKPALASDICFGALALLHVEAGFAQALLDAWHRGESSLRRYGPRLHLAER